MNNTFVEDNWDYESNDTYYYDQDYIRDEYGDVICEGATEAQRKSYSEFAWWMEGIGQMTVGGIGFLANCIAIPILCSKEMSSIFNRLLTCLAIFDNTYLICSLVDGVRRHFISSQVIQFTKFPQGSISQCIFSVDPRIRFWVLYVPVPQYGRLLFYLHNCSVGFGTLPRGMASH